MEDCLFCKIAAKEIPSEIVLESEELIAFKDINPKAPIHLLIIPKKHISRIENLGSTETELAGKLIISATKLAKKLAIEKGYRLVFNNGVEGGQEVEHIHLHLLAGRQMNWPPG